MSLFFATQPSHLASQLLSPICLRS